MKHTAHAPLTRDGRDSVATASGGEFLTRASCASIASACGGAFFTRFSGVSIARACGGVFFTRCLCCQILWWIIFYPRQLCFRQRSFVVIEPLVKVIKIFSGMRVQRRFLEQSMAMELFEVYAEVEDSSSWRRGSGEIDSHAVVPEADGG